MLKIKNITKIYELKHEMVKALNEVNVELANNGLVLLTGESGSGKTTLLNLIGGFDKASYGEIINEDILVDKLNNKELNDYRNLHIGYINQEIDLFNVLNVIENITLLNKSEETTANMDLLKIKELESRKINEISSGQKQRVSIARSLNKNALILLADEPTENLDQNNAILIFELLKSISKDRLVIVASHDIALAQKYADQIIKLENGQVVSNEIINSKEDINRTKNNIPHKLSFKNIAKFIKGFLFESKKKLILSTIVISLSLIFFMLSLMLKEFNLPKIHTETMINESEKYVAIINKWDYIIIPPLIEKLKKDNNINKKIQISNTYYQNGNPLTITTSNTFKISDATAYYSATILKTHVYEINDYAIDKDAKIIGKMPKEKNEILINQFTAELLKYYGVYKIVNGEEIEFAPNNIEEILNQEIKFGDWSNQTENYATIKITGIIEKDLSKYERLKKLRVENLNKNEELLFKDFAGKNLSYRNIYVTKEFKNYINDFVNYQLKTDSSILTNANEMVTTPFYEFNDPVETKNGNIYNLSENEIIISEEIASYLTNTNINEKITLYNVSKDYNEYIIKGISTDNNNYISKKASEKLLGGIRSVSTYLLEDDKTVLNKIFKTYDIKESDSLSSSTAYSDRILEHLKTLNILSNIFIYLSTVFLIFSIIMLTNYINNSIFVHKKDIAILKSLGIENKVIKRIFTLEVLSISGISFLITLIISTIIMIISNLIISNKLMFYFHPVRMNPINIILSLVIIGLITFILINLLLRKISKQNIIEI